MAEVLAEVLAVVALEPVPAAALVAVTPVPALVAEVLAASAWRTARPAVEAESPQRVEARAAAVAAVALRRTTRVAEAVVVAAD
jgi:hypothetical protein